VRVTCVHDVGHAAPSDPASALTGTAGPLPQGPAGDPGAAGATGSAGATGATGPAGPAGRDAKVTCRVRRTAKRKVICKVRLVSSSSSSSARVRWRLSRNGRTVAHGSVRARDGRATLRLSSLANLRNGRYVFRLGGRRAATFVLR
jgi:hypothetical protein